MGAGSNVFDLGVEGASAAIFAALDRALDDAGLSEQDDGAIQACFAGVAGAGAAGSALALRDQLAQRLNLNHARCVVERDVCNAHAGALGGGAGAVLIAGTGSVCLGRAGDGRTASAGGWGTLIDDPGSGSRLGLRAMGAVVRAADGRGPRTTLTPILFEHLGVDSPAAMLALWRGSRVDRRALAAMARLVLGAAERGDGPASEIAGEGAQELARMIEAVRARLAIAVGDRWPIVPVGGLVQTGSYFRDCIVAALAQIVPGVVVGLPVLPPSGGSLLLALELNGIKPTPPVIARIKDALPG